MNKVSPIGTPSPLVGRKQPEDLSLCEGRVTAVIQRSLPTSDSPKMPPPPSPDLTLKRPTLPHINLKNSSGRTMLHMAVASNLLHHVCEILALGGDVHLGDSCGSTPFAEALNAKPINLDIITALVNHSTFDVHHMEHGLTPLHRAVRTGNYEVVSLMFDKGAKKNQFTQIRRNNVFHQDLIDGETALHIAAATGYTEIVQLLLQKGADIDAKSYLGQTPLHLAIKAGHLEIVKVLNEHPGNLKLRNVEGYTPENWAKKYGSPAIKTYFGIPLDPKTDEDPDGFVFI